MVDALRGYALLGLFLVHMTGYYELYNARPTPSWVQEATRVLFQGKSFSLLAICFGFSFDVQLAGARRRGEAFAGRFGWRMALLLAIGWCHALLYRGDILMVLAIAGLLLIPLDRIRSPRLLAVAAAALLLQPPILVRILAAAQGAGWALAPPLFYDDGGALGPSLSGSFGALVGANAHAHLAKWSYFLETGRMLQVLGFFLVGILLARAGAFAAPGHFARGFARAFALAIAALPPLVIAAQLTAGRATGPAFWASVLVGGWIDLAGTTIAFVLFAALWTWRAGRSFGWLEPVGRMTLSLYVGQSLVFVPVFYGFGLHLWDRITQEGALLLGLAAAGCQVVGAHLWFRRFAYGPLEWLWRAGTSLSLDIPFLRRPEPLQRAAS